jgi:tRNA-uridine 2-sulfurtransferase
MSMNKQRVVVGMSGGVDSSVAAYLLLQQGYEVIGLFMRNWNDADVTLEDECPWIDDSRDAMMVAEQLGIPFQVIDLSEVYKERIVDYMFNEYEMGRTPNPDVLCNREIKFDVFLQNALKLGADFVATGHYVQKQEVVVDGVTEYQLIAGLDPNKDQSYFLCQLNQFQLSKALFPIGGILKPEVRLIAEKANLVTATKKDSQGLCFIGKVRLPEFLQQQLKVKVGQVVEIEENNEKVIAHFDKLKDSTLPWQNRIAKLKFTKSDGKVVGDHNGAHFYTVGQRKGLNIGGKPKPLFVLQTDVVENIIYVGQGEDHSGLYSAGLLISKEEAHWVRPSMKQIALKSSDLMCRIRYRQSLFHCQLIEEPNGSFILSFETPQKSVTAGQFATIYFENELIFSGVIS